jgi:hypothetical protein
MVPAVLTFRLFEKQTAFHDIINEEKSTLENATCTLTMLQSVTTERWKRSHKASAFYCSVFMIGKRLEQRWRSSISEAR